jgi:hypothetical protein
MEKRKRFTAEFKREAVRLMRGIDMRKWLQAALSITALSASIACGHQVVSQRQKITGMYSNMSYNNEGGDILGVEVFLVYSRDGYRVVYQSSEGEPASPIVLPARIDGKTISFSLPSNIDPRGNFAGNIEPTELVGRFSGNGQTVHLMRRPSYWQ